MVLAVSIVVSGTVFYSQVEGWSVVDALYFCVVTLTTIGFGDIAPVTTAGKLFTIAYSLIGIGVLASFVTAIALAERADWQERTDRRKSKRRSRHDGDDQARRTDSAVLSRGAGQGDPAPMWPADWFVARCYRTLDS